MIIGSQIIKAKLIIYKMFKYEDYIKTRLFESRNYHYQTLDLKRTNYYFRIMLKEWYTLEDRCCRPVAIKVTFDEVLESSPPEIQECLLFNIDLFV